MHVGGRPGAYVGGRLGAQAPRMRSRIGTIESAAAGGGGGGGCGGPGKDASLPRVGGAGLEALRRRLQLETSSRRGLVESFKRKLCRS